MTRSTAGIPADFINKTKEPDATIRIGPHVLKLERAAFEAWENEIAAKVGFSKPAIVSEIKRRLGIA